MSEWLGTDCLYDAAQEPLALLLLAHGAGAAMDSDFMNAMAAALASQSVAVLRFEFRICNGGATNSGNFHRTEHPNC